MKPLQQGSLDALCGLYSIVNAIEVVGLKGPRCAFHKHLFDRLVMGLDREVLRDAVADGLGPDELITTARKAFRWLDRRYGLRLKMTVARRAAFARDAGEYLDWFDSATADGRHAVIVSVVMPWLDHWTVAARREGRKLIVRDSLGLQSLDLGRFTLGGGAYRIRADHTLLIARTDGGGPAHLKALQRSRDDQG
ncbi:MAG: hypothetical protein K2X07_00210 [Caulobacteraceae bacterium]|nr:hypothetical protein [Caulobacteraceae bacterium]